VVNDVIKSVASQLGNTPAICRKCYVHPAVLEAFVADELSKLGKPRTRKGLRPEEVTLMRFLEQVQADSATTKP